MNVACENEAPMQMLTTEKYIAAGPARDSPSHADHGNLAMGP